MSNVTRKRGDTYPHRIALSDAATRQPLNILGYTFKLTVDLEQFPADDDNNLFQIEGAIEDATNGVVSFPFDTTDADHIGAYYYDIELTDTAGKIRTVQAGEFVMVQDITK